jgi:hypothetical protein
MPALMEQCEKTLIVRLLKIDHQHLYADSNLHKFDNLHKFEPPKPAELKTFRLDTSVKEAALAERFRRAILKSSLCRVIFFFVKKVLCIGSLQY